MNIVIKTEISNGRLRTKISLWGILKMSLVFGLWFLALNSPFAYGEVTPLKEILNQPDIFDRKHVEIEGEAIGEVLKDPGGGWVNIASKGYNIGIFSPDAKTLERIEYWGSYKEKGDQLKIKGIFYKNCPWHQISGVHLETLEIVEKGGERVILVSPFKRRLATILFAMSLMIAVIYLIKRKYGREAQPITGRISKRSPKG